MHVRASLALATSLVAAVAVAHPHFDKTVTVQLPGGVEARVSYNTTSSNEELAAAVAVGDFATPRRPVLVLSGDLEAGETRVPAGEYTIGVVRKGDSEWVMALHPGRLGRRDQPDTSKLIELDSHFSTSRGTAGHMLVDITPGSGERSGQVMLTMHFGSMYLAGAIS